MSPKNIRMIFNPEQEISQYLSYFSKEVSQWTDRQTYKNFRIIWNWCTNIPEMSPKNFRKISYQELVKSKFLWNLMEMFQGYFLTISKSFWSSCMYISLLVGLLPNWNSAINVIDLRPHKTFFVNYWTLWNILINSGHLTI